MGEGRPRRVLHAAHPGVPARHRRLPGPPEQRRRGARRRRLPGRLLTPPAAILADPLGRRGGPLDTVPQPLGAGDAAADRPCFVGSRSWDERSHINGGKRESAFFDFDIDFDTPGTVARVNIRVPRCARVARRRMYGPRDLDHTAATTLWRRQGGGEVLGVFNHPPPTPPSRLQLGRGSCPRGPRQRRPGPPLRCTPGCGAARISRTPHPGRPAPRPQARSRRRPPARPAPQTRPPRPCPRRRPPRRSRTPWTC
mmetsp:Transcript_25366/g.65839  ORF Transcript_25366/g.65839 Transcript_25366/m.65839 type:complete len:254 (+) Transcript_25366:1576-2337(+)